MQELRRRENDGIDVRGYEMKAILFEMEITRRHRGPSSDENKEIDR